MIRDLGTMVWKEWREFREQLLSWRRGGLSAMVLALVLGVVTPAQMGPDWLYTDFMTAYWPFVAASMVSSLIADSVAGERERHTLETLLATRLPDAAILLGKIVAAVLYGLMFALANLLIGWITVNVVHGHGSLLPFPLAHVMTIIGFTILASALVAGLGVFISLRAATVKQAQQTFGISIVILLMGPLLAFQMLSRYRRMQLLELLTRTGRDRIALYVAAVMLAATLIVLVAALARFRRGKLAVD